MGSKHGLDWRLRKKGRSSSHLNQEQELKWDLCAVSTELNFQNRSVATGRERDPGRGLQDRKWYPDLGEWGAGKWTRSRNDAGESVHSSDSLTI